MADETNNQQMNTGAGAPPPQSATANQPPNPMPNPMDAANKVNANSQPQQTAQPQQQPQQDSGQPVAAKADLSKTPAAQPGAAATTNPNSQQQQKGSWFHSLAESLAGGPRFKTTYNPKTDSIERVKVPLSGGQIGLAIALEALSGGLAGLGAKGPNHFGQSIQRGMGVGQQMVQNQKNDEQQQMEKAQGDFTRHYQVTEANARMLNLAMTMSRADQAQHESLVKNSSEYIAWLKENDPSAIGAEHLSEQDASDLTKYPINEYIRRVDGFGPRIDPATGKPVFIDNFGRAVPQDTPGARPAYDNSFAMIHKHANGAFTDGDSKPQPWVVRAAGHNLIAPSMLTMNAGPNATISGATQSILEHRSDVVEATQKDISRVFKMYNDSKAPADGNVPNIADQQIASTLDSAAEQNGLPKGLLRAVAMVESGDQKTGNINAHARSPKGAQGVLQLMPATAKQYGVTDPNDPQQNIAGGAKYLADLVKQSGKGNTPEGYRYALQHYLGSGPTDGNMSPQQYADKVLGMSGVGQAPSPDGLQVPDLDKAIGKDPSLPAALDKFNALFNRTGSYEEAVKQLAAKDPNAAGRVSALFGGHAMLHEFDQLQSMYDQQRKATQTRADKVADEEALGPIKAKNEALKQQLKDDAEKSIPKELVEAAKNEPVVNHVKAGFLASLPPEDAAIVKQIGEGRADNVSGYALGRSPQAQKIRAEVSLAYPEFDWSRAVAYEKARVKFTSGEEASQLRLLNTAMAHIGIVQKSAGFFNTKPIIGSAMSGLGIQDATDLETARTGLKTEIPRIYKGGVPDVAEMRQWADLIDRWGKDGTKAENKSMLKVLDSRIAALVTQWKNAMPPSAVLPEGISFLSPEALHTYREIAGKANDGKPIDPEWMKDARDAGWLKEDSPDQNTAASKTANNTGGNSAPTWNAPNGAPPASGLPDGKVLKSNGQVVAVAKGGQWTDPNSK